jgi:hypothetical protein
MMTSLEIMNTTIRRNRLGNRRVKNSTSFHSCVPLYWYFLGIYSLHAFIPRLVRKAVCTTKRAHSHLYAQHEHLRPGPLKNADTGIACQLILRRIF